MDSSRRCEAITVNGSSCQAAPQPHSPFCFFHDESKAEKRRAAQALGGRQNRVKTLDATASEVKLSDIGDIISLLSETINQVRTGAIDPRVANCVGFLANIAIKVFDQRDLDARLEKLEKLERSGRADLTLTADCG